MSHALSTALPLLRGLQRGFFSYLRVGPHLEHGAANGFGVYRREATPP